MKYHPVHLVVENGYTHFLLYITDPNVEFQLQFEVWQVNSWDSETKEPLSDPAIGFMDELYMTGVIKWDGCSHVYFGEREEGKQRQDAYLHLCGTPCWERHQKLMAEVYAHAAKTITRSDIKVSGRREEPEWLVEASRKNGVVANTLAVAEKSQLTDLETMDLVAQSLWQVVTTLETQLLDQARNAPPPTRIDAP